MKKNPQEAIEQTAQALGEGPRRMAASAESVRTGDVAELVGLAQRLQAEGRLPALRLHAAQRQSVMALAREMDRQRRRRLVLNWGLWPMAAAALLVLGFWLGDQQGQPHAGLPNHTASLPSPLDLPQHQHDALTPKPGPSKPQLAQAAPAALPQQAPAPAGSLVVASTAPAPRPPDTKPSKPIQPDQKSSPPAAQNVVARPASSAATATRPVTDQRLARLRLEPMSEMMQAARQERDLSHLEPREIRPMTKVANLGQQLASPLRKGKPQLAAAPVRSAEQVYIHAWRAQSHACPWNPQRRLLRISIQLPPKQAAADTGDSFPLEVEFDSRVVRHYRRLATRFEPAASLETAGQQSLWYEVEPVAQESLSNGRAMAQVRLVKGRFTTPAAGPFDESKLQVLDRGQGWEAAPADYLFESAVVGLGLLLQGGQDARLNHDLLKTLTQRGIGSDASGQRQRFLRELEAIRRAAGL